MKSGPGDGVQSVDYSKIAVLVWRPPAMFGIERWNWWVEQQKRFSLARSPAARVSHYSLSTFSLYLHPLSFISRGGPNVPKYPLETTNATVTPSLPRESFSTSKLYALMPRSGARNWRLRLSVSHLFKEREGYLEDQWCLYYILYTPLSSFWCNKRECQELCFDGWKSFLAPSYKSLLSSIIKNNDSYQTNYSHPCVRNQWISRRLFQGKC